MVDCPHGEGPDSGRENPFPKVVAVDTMSSFEIRWKTGEFRFGVVAVVVSPFPSIRRIDS